MIRRGDLEQLQAIRVVRKAQRQIAEARANVAKLAVEAARRTCSTADEQLLRLSQGWLASLTPPNWVPAVSTLWSQAIEVQFSEQQAASAQVQKSLWDLEDALSQWREAMMADDLCRKQYRKLETSRRRAHEAKRNETVDDTNAYRAVQS